MCVVFFSWKYSRRNNSKSSVKIQMFTYLKTPDTRVCLFITYLDIVNS